jgi:hypothetical protein
MNRGQIGDGELVLASRPQLRTKHTDHHARAVHESVRDRERHQPAKSEIQNYLED